MRTSLAAVAVAALATLPSAAAAERVVTISSSGFVPSGVSIAAHDTVTWRNTDTRPHQVVFDRVPCNLTIAPGASASCIFRSGGKFNYRDPTAQGRAFRGTVTVSGPRTSVTLSPSRRVVPFSAPVALSGVVSSLEAGQSVAVSGQECGKTTFSALGSATTTTGGNWTYTARPRQNTVFRARWRTTDSATVAVSVRPAMRLTRVRGRFAVRVTAAQSFTGKLVLFQRYRAAVRRWATVKRVTLGAARAPSAGTFVTSATFRSRVRRGWRVRAFLPQAQAGTCYVAGATNSLRIR